MKKSTLFIVFAVFFIISGCTSSNEQPISLSKKYPGDIERVNKVLIISGNTGEKKEITDQKAINEWINKVKDIELYRSENQEERDGFTFYLSLFEGDSSKLSINLGKIGKTYYNVDDYMLEMTRELFNYN